MICEYVVDRQVQWVRRGIVHNRKKKKTQRTHAPIIATTIHAPRMLSIAHRPSPSHLLSACHRRRRSAHNGRQDASGSQPACIFRHAIEYVGCARAMAAWAMAAQAMAAWAIAARNLACMVSYYVRTVSYCSKVSIFFWFGYFRSRRPKFYESEICCVWYVTIICTVCGVVCGV